LLLKIEANAQQITEACYEKPTFVAQDEPTFCEQFDKYDLDRVVGSTETMLASAIQMLPPEPQE